MYNSWWGAMAFGPGICPGKASMENYGRLRLYDILEDFFSVHFLH
jgi:hypothetical protein